MEKNPKIQQNVNYNQLPLYCCTGNMLHGAPPPLHGLRRPPACKGELPLHCYAGDVLQCTHTPSLAGEPSSMSPHGYSWFDGLHRNPRSGVQTPQVLGYSGMRVALNPCLGVQTPTRWSNPPRLGVGVPHAQSGYTLKQISGRNGTKNHPTHMQQDTRGWTTLPIG